MPPALLDKLKKNAVPLAMWLAGVVAAVLLARYTGEPVPAPPFPGVLSAPGGCPCGCPCP